MQISMRRPRRRQHLTVPHHNMAKTRCEDEKHPKEPGTDAQIAQPIKTYKREKPQMIKTPISEAN